MELWRREDVERSRAVLRELHQGIPSIVVIGGWAVYFSVRKLGSWDVDLCVDFDDHIKLSSYATKKGSTVELIRDRKTRKNAYYIATIDEVRVEWVTPDLTTLKIPAKDILSKKLWFVSEEGVRIIKPEVALFLKVNAEMLRKEGSLKQFKDRCDILSLLLYKKFDLELVKGLLERYPLQREIGRTFEIIKSSTWSEYSYIDGSLGGYTEERLRKKILSTPVMRFLKSPKSGRESETA